MINRKYQNYLNKKIKAKNKSYNTIEKRDKKLSKQGNDSVSVFMDKITKKHCFSNTFGGLKLNFY